jgi:hypothetical protein
LGLPFPGIEPGTFIPKSHFIDRPLNHYTTASIQRISLKVHAAICVYKPGNQRFPAPLLPGGDERPLQPHCALGDECLPPM